MRAWRIAAARHAIAPLDGEGSRLFGGRWSSVGVRVAYTSESIALAVLETLVHYDTDTIPDDLVLIAVDIPDAVQVETLAGPALPRNWRAYPAPVALQMLGDAWVKRAHTAVFNTPSALVPEERNLLINPAHPDFAKIKSRTIRPFAFDPRMFEAGSSPELRRAGKPFRLRGRIDSPLGFPGALGQAHARRS